MRHARPTVDRYEQKSLSESEREYQTKMIMQLFAHWKLTTEQSAIVLGLSPNTPTSIYKYKTGKLYLPLDRDLQDRIVYLLTIHKYLKRAYPFNKELAYRWITTKNKDFDRQTPFDYICKYGFLGLIKIRNYLELNE